MLWAWSQRKGQDGGGEKKAAEEKEIPEPRERKGKKILTGHWELVKVLKDRTEDKEKSSFRETCVEGLSETCSSFSH